MNVRFSAPFSPSPTYYLCLCNFLLDPRSYVILHLIFLYLPRFTYIFHQYLQFFNFQLFYVLFHYFHFSFLEFTTLFLCPVMFTNHFHHFPIFLGLCRFFPVSFLFLAFLPMFIFFLVFCTFKLYLIIRIVLSAFFPPMIFYIPIYVYTSDRFSCG